MELMSIVSKLNETIPTDGGREVVPTHTGLLEQIEERLLSLHRFLGSQESPMLFTDNERRLEDDQCSSQWLEKCYRFIRGSNFTLRATRSVTSASKKLMFFGNTSPNAFSAAALLRTTPMTSF